MKNFLPELFIMTIFIGLKLEGYWDVSWLVVLAPIWVSILATILIPIIAIIAVEIESAREAKKSYIAHIAAKCKPLYWDAKTQTMYGDFEVK